MAIVLVGVDHRKTPAEVVERLVAGSDDLQELAAGLMSSGDADEVVALSTCLRSEVYLSTQHPARVVEIIERALVPDKRLSNEVLFALDEREVLVHLFRIAGGLESTMLGEAEILGQVARAWEFARAKGTSGPVLDGLFRHAIATGKRARSDTLISRGVTSIAHAAVAMAKKQAFDLRDKRILIVGAGDMSERMALAAARADGVAGVVIANRTWHRAKALADRIGGKAIDFSKLDEVLRDVDAVFTSTGAASPIITKQMVAEAGSLLIVDFAVPRDTEVGVEDLDGLQLLLMEDLQEFANAGVEARAGEVQAVEAIVDSEMARYEAFELERSMAPAISQLRDHVENIRSAEFERYSKKLQGLDDSQREAIEAMTKAMMNKLLHEPTVRLKEAAGMHEGEQLAEALRSLFDY